MGPNTIEPYIVAVLQKERKKRNSMAIGVLEQAYL
jgi:hypothetical protein